VANATKQAVHVSDGDSLARFTSFKVVLNQPALLTWRIVDGAGRVVRSIRDGEHVPPGALAFSWDGRNDHGAWVTDGVYRSVVSAQTGLGEYSAERRVLVGAFLITSSNAAPTRGERLTVNLVSTESLDRSPTVRVIQDGVPPWTVTARHVSGRRYRASIVLQAGGPPGSVQIQVTGVDTRSGVQSSSVSFPLQ
jgi:hypothetical protein